MVTRAASATRRLAVFSGAFNPPTLAHRALAEAALAVTDEVLFVVPRAFPHKSMSGATLKERLELLQLTLRGEPRFSVAASQGGLFVDIARECRAAYGMDVQLLFLCGRDTAERIIGWDYGDCAALPAMLREFQLLVAPRPDEYDPPEHCRHAVETLPLEAAWRDVSSSEVRRRLADGQAWEHLVAPAAAGRVREIYGKTE